jgi:hypothetical protein
MQSMAIIPFTFGMRMRVLHRLEEGETDKLWYK